MKRIIASLLSIVLVLTLFPLVLSASEDQFADSGEPVYWSLDEDRIEVDLNTYADFDISSLVPVSGTDVFLPIVEDTPAAADLDSMVAEYAPSFNGQNVKLRLKGEPVDCLRFLQSFQFGSLDVEFEWSQGLTEQDISEDHGYADSKIYKLKDVQGLTKLLIEDGDTFSTNLDMDDVFPDLTDLTLRLTNYGYHSIFGNLTSRQMPSLKHLTVLLNSMAYIWDLADRIGLLFPEGLETLDIYKNDMLVDPAEITDPFLIAALEMSCPDVLVNGVRVSDLTPVNAFDGEPRDSLLYGRTATTAKKILDYARYAAVPLSYDAPHVYGKLLFVNMESGYYDFNVPGCVEEISYYNGMSAGLFENYWEYTSLATPEELDGTFGADSGMEVWMPREVPQEILADGVNDADVMIIFYTVRTQLGAHNGDETPYRTDTNVVIADLQSGTLYAPYTAYSVDPYAEEDPYYYSEPPVYIATAQIMEAYNGDGYVAQAAQGRNSISVPSGPAEASPSDTTNAAAAPGTSLPDAALTADILTVLNNGIYSDTLAALQGGEVISYGAVSQTAAGLQQTLVDFGCDIAVDGSAGPGTFAALNSVLESFGMEQTDAVDAPLYAELLKLLLIGSNEPAARSLLADQYGEGKDGGEFDYLRGCALYAQGRYYSAKEAFEYSQYKDYQERAAACVQPWPGNGELWHNSSYYSQSMYLSFQINSYDESIGRYFKVFAEDGTLAACLFITGSGTVSTSLPGGIYKIMDATGDTWYGTSEAFGPDGYYEYMVFDEVEGDRYLTILDAGYEWTISVNVTENTGGTGVGSESFDWDSWTAN